ncbi:(2Fe-2S)-binding protein [Planotetraspora sp. GP83]|uniref:(2Fe-2S)-binding protein n=1 Tax=Planotetraspora sp. GP83 TaxID=3156264 RepID=UPI003513544A
MTESGAQEDVEIKLSVNGRPVAAAVEPRTTLAGLLRGELGLTGTNIGCDTTSCGACTVLLDGRAVKSCTVLGAQVHGRPVVTIEGLADGDRLHPVQRAFHEHHAVQCGFCTPGMVLAAVSLLGSAPGPLTEQDVRLALKGNLCRCTGYHNIIQAVLAVANGDE